jgi:hypothetical protein
MTGQEHYREAQRLLLLSHGATFKDDETTYARQAQAHAILAIAAAQLEIAERGRPMRDVAL